MCRRAQDRRTREAVVLWSTTCEGKGGNTLADFFARPLDVKSWPGFARLVEKHNGVWGGCWCIAFHPKAGERRLTADVRRADKEAFVREGRAHAALVYDGCDAIGWCQFGSPDELPGIKHERQYLLELNKLPDWRITCFFVDKDYRHRGVANFALEAALKQIAALGGGVVESYPEDVEGRKTSSSFLHGGTVSMFERLGFQRGRGLGMHHCVMRKFVEPDSAS